MKRINYQSDFDFVLRIGHGEIPTYNWEAVFYTSNRSDAFRASHWNGKYTGCHICAGEIHVVANAHSLAPGNLICELTSYIPNTEYPDNSRKIVSPVKTDITLVNGNGDDGNSFCVDLSAPIVMVTAYDLAVRNGYSGSLEDYSHACALLPRAVEAFESLGDDIFDGIDLSGALPVATEDDIIALINPKVEKPSNKQ